MEGTLTEDALLGGRVQLLQPARGYRVAIDAVLLAAAVDAVPGQRILDLGAGVGAVGLCLAARLAGCCVVGIELQPALAELAERNANLNGMADRVRTIIHDLAKPLPEQWRTFLVSKGVPKRKYTAVLKATLADGTVLETLIVEQGWIIATDKRHLAGTFEQRITFDPRSIVEVQVVQVV